MSDGNSDSERDMIRRIQSVIACEGTAFADVLKAAGIDPKRGLRYRNLSGLSFEGQDLRGMDFTGANIVDCDFSGALVEGARFERARLRELRPIDRVYQSLALQAKDWSSYSRSWVALTSDLNTDDLHLPVGCTFKDAPELPEMLVVPGVVTASGEPRPRVAISLQPVQQIEIDFALPFEGASGSMPHLSEDADSPTLSELVMKFTEWATQRAQRTYRALHYREWELYCGPLGLTHPYAAPGHQHVARNAFGLEAGVHVGREWCLNPEGGVFYSAWGASAARYSKLPAFRVARDF